MSLATLGESVLDRNKHLFFLFIQEMESYLEEELGRNQPLDLSKPKVRWPVFGIINFGESVLDRNKHLFFFIHSGDGVLPGGGAWKEPASGSL
jgi:GH43 family beta-xylosidase